MATTFNFIRHSKEVAKAVRYETHNCKILGSNPAALTISLSHVIKVNKNNFYILQICTMLVVIIIIKSKILFIKIHTI